MKRGWITACAVLVPVFAHVAHSAPVALLGPSRPGDAIHQQFRPDGTSVVTSPTGRMCIVSRRIGIESSVYLDRQGSAVPFTAIRRSPASSLQAVDDGSGAVWYRLQMKYPLDRSRPVIMTLDGATLDLAPMLEPSGDSLRLTGSAAAALTAAFAAGAQPALTGFSDDTGHLVSDTLDPPDVTALSDCAASIGTLPATSPALTNEVRVTFAGSPETAPLASLPDLQACGMKEPPGELRAVRLSSVTGFFAHTDRAFASFHEDGSVARFYISGIVDADLTPGRVGEIRLSRAANANLPDTENQVKGCLGSAADKICSYSRGDGTHVLADCMPEGGILPSEPGLPGVAPPAGGPPRLTGLPPPRTPPGFTPPPGFFPPLSPPPPIRVVTGGEDSPTTDSGGDPPPPPSPVPLPAPGLLLLAALAGLAHLRRRRSA